MRRRKQRVGHLAGVPGAKIDDGLAVLTDFHQFAGVLREGGQHVVTQFDFTHRVAADDQPTAPQLQQRHAVGQERVAGAKKMQGGGGFAGVVRRDHEDEMFAGRVEHT